MFGFALTRAIMFAVAAYQCREALFARLLVWPGTTWCRDAGYTLWGGRNMGRRSKDHSLQANATQTLSFYLAMDFYFGQFWGHLTHPFLGPFLDYFGSLFETFWVYFFGGSFGKTVKKNP